MDDVLALALLQARQRRQLLAPATARRVRQRADVTQKVVACTLGVSTTCVSLWERGKRRPRDPELIARYVELLQVLARESAARLVMRNAPAR